MFLRYSIRISLLFWSIFAVSAYALTYPVTTPTWETTGGTYRTYFDNIFQNFWSDCSASGKVVWWFDAVWVPNCVTPVSSGLFLIGQSTGDTIRFNGTDWERTNLIYNSSTGVGIGTTSPGYILDVGWTANFIWLRMPTGAGSGRVLTSNAAGQMYWATSVSWATASGITWGTQNYIPKFGTWGNGLILSQLYDNGTNIWIGTPTPSAKLDISTVGTNPFQIRSGNGAWIYANNQILFWWNGSDGYRHAIKTRHNWWWLSDNAIDFYVWDQSADASTTVGTRRVMSIDGANNGSVAIGTPVATSWSKLEIAGQIKITWGWVWSGKVLTSDTGGLARWDTVTASSMAASGITWGVEWYLSRFGTGWNGLYASVIYQSGNRLGIGTGVVYPGYTLNIDSGVSNVTGIRFGRVNSSSPLFTSGPTIPVWVNGSGELVPVQWGMIPVYTALGASQNAAVNTSIDPPTIGANYDKYFNIPARQAFTVTDVWGNPYNCPEFQIWSSNKGATWCSQTPWATYVMTAQNDIIWDRYAYQILISDRTDAPFVVRGWMYSTASGTLMNTAKTIPALWFKALTVPTNHSDWLYVNPGVDQNNNPIAGWGYVGIGTITPSTTLDLSWSLRVRWGSPWLGKILTSDALGNATWSAGFSGTTTASGITGWTQNFVTKFGTWGNWLVNSQIFDNGSNIGIGTWTNLTTKLTIDSGIDDDSGLRFARIDTATPLTANGVLALWVNASGKVLPISPISNIAVYNGVDRVTVMNPNPDLNTFNITYDFNRYFAIPGKQSFVVSSGDSSSYNGPYFKENGTSALCSINGTYGTSPYDCADPDPATSLSASPYNSFTMTAKWDSVWYQIVLAARWDAPLFARSWVYNGSQTGWLYLNEAPFQTPAPWQKLISVPANHSEYLYINTGLNSQLQTQTGGGNVGIGTTNPQSRFEVWTGATTTSLIHFRGANNVGMGFGASRPQQTGNANSAFWNESLYTVTTGYSNTAIGYRALRLTGVGFNNSALWQDALYNNAGGSWNTAAWYQALYSVTSGTGNIGLWVQSLYNLSTGNNNIAIGSQAARVIAGSAVSNNIAIGYQSLYSATTSNLLAVGHEALYSNAWWAGNQAVWFMSLFANTSGNYNTADGYETLFGNTTGANNTAVGYQALRTTSTSSNNTALGYQALYANTASSNTAIWQLALRTNTSGRANTAVWLESLYANTTGTNNVAIGLQTLNTNSTGWENVAVWKWAMGNAWSAPQNNTVIGTSAWRGGGTNSSYNTMIWHTAGYAINGGNYNTLLWYMAGSGLTTGSNNIVIGNNASVPSATASNQLSIGNWIYGNGGNIGIATSSPSVALDVNGQVRIRGGAPGAGKVLMSDSGWIATWQTPTGAAAIPWSISGNSTTDPASNFVGTLDNVWLSFRTNNTEWMRLLTNGNLGIGTTSASGKLDVNGTSFFRNTVTMTPNQDINFQSPGIASASPGGFNWLLSTDSAEMYALERASDNTDYTFKMGDNATDDGDRFVFWQTSWNGIASDRWPLIMNGTWAAFDPRFTWNTSAGAMQDATMYMNYTNRNVGIFTNSPDASTKLDVNGTVRIRWGSPGIGKILVSDANWVASWQTAATGSFAGWWILGNAGTSPVTNFMGTTDNVDVVFRTNGTEKMRIQAGWNVGIGVTNPGAKLDILGNVRAGSATPNTMMGTHATYGNTYSAWWKDGADYSMLTDGTQTYLNAPAAAGNIYLRTANSDKMFIRGSDGNVGIGNVNPGAKLEVTGQVKITGGSPAAGKVLTSDAAGLASWVLPTIVLTGGTTNYITKWTSASNVGTSTMFDNGTNVGVGTASPASKLDVNGNLAVRWDAGGSIYTWNGGNTNWRWGTSNAPYTRVIATGYNQFAIFGAASGNGFSVGDANTGLSAFEVTSSTNSYKSYFRGNVGIGIDPTQPLDVNGQVRIRGGSPGVGKVLVSDANGVGTWVAPAGSQTGTYIYRMSTSQSSTNTTLAGVTQLTSTPLPVGPYQFELIGKFQSAAVNTGLGLTLAQTSWSSTNFIGTMSAQLTTTTMFSSSFMTAGTAVTSTDVPAANTDYAVFMKGSFDVTATGTVAVRMATENNGTQVTLGVGTVLIIKSLDPSIAGWGI